MSSCNPLTPRHDLAVAGHRLQPVTTPLTCEDAPRSVAVVIPRLEDLHLFVIGAVDQAMFVVDASGQVPGQLAFQRLWLSYPSERVALDLTDQAGDPRRHLPVCAEPVQEVFPGIGVEVDASQLLTGSTTRPPEPGVPP